MDVAEFEDLIDRLGEDLSCWPDAQRQAAEALLASSSDAQKRYKEAQTVRQALAGPPLRAPAGLADRIVTAATRLNVEPETPRAQDATTESGGAAQSGKVLPVLLLALCLLPIPDAPPASRVNASVVHASL